MPGRTKVAAVRRGAGAAVSAWIANGPRAVQHVVQRAPSTAATFGQRALREVVWEAVVGHPLPKGWTVDYLDGAPTNISYRNLELVTDMERVIRRRRGTANVNATFSVEQVRDILASDETSTQLAAPVRRRPHHDQESESPSQLR